MAKPPTNQNRHNRPENRSPKSRQFKGIRMRKWGKWVSEIRMPNSRRRIWLGSYDIPEKAARAYDFAVYCLKGSKAKFNFPDSPPEIHCAASLSPPQIQAAASKFAAQEFRLPLEDDLASSSSRSEAESGIERQWISVEQGTELWDSILEDLNNCESIPSQDLSESPPEIPCASSLFPPQIQSATPKFAAEEFWLPLEDDAASSSSHSEAESGIEGQWISVEQDTAIWDSVLEDMGNHESKPFEDFTHSHISMEDTDILFQHTDNWVQRVSKASLRPLEISATQVQIYTFLLTEIP